MASPSSSSNSWVPCILLVIAVICLAIFQAHIHTHACMYFYTDIQYILSLPGITEWLRLKETSGWKVTLSNPCSSQTISWHHTMFLGSRGQTWVPPIHMWRCHVTSSDNQLVYSLVVKCYSDIAKVVEFSSQKDKLHQNKTSYFCQAQYMCSKCLHTFSLALCVAFIPGLSEDRSLGTFMKGPKGLFYLHFYILHRYLTLTLNTFVFRFTKDKHHLRCSLNQSSLLLHLCFVALSSVRQ